MTLYLQDLVSIEELELAIASKWMARKLNPEGTKYLYCYTPKAQYEQAWTDVTTKLRGVVVDAETNQVLARPFPKFFNHGDPRAPVPSMDTPVWAADKMDGSLAVLQPDGTMTSKGSFTSDVAKAATRLYQERYAGKWEPMPDLTYCFEYTSPDHRIVLDYGPREELTLIGAVATGDGFIYDPRPSVFPEWPGPTADILANGEPFEDVLAMPPREDAEGLVVIWGKGNVLKIKQDDYLAMHRLVTNTNATTVWEAMAVNDCHAHGAGQKSMVAGLKLSPEKIDQALELGPRWIDKLSETVPDEFHDWLKRTRWALAEAFLDGWLEVQDLQSPVAKLGMDRGEVARFLQARAGDTDLPWNISMEVWLNGGKLTDRARASLWLHIKPTGARWGMAGTGTE